MVLFKIIINKLCVNDIIIKIQFEQHSPHLMPHQPFKDGQYTNIEC